MKSDQGRKEREKKRNYSDTHSCGVFKILYVL